MPTLRIGLIADVHHADLDDREGRRYRDGLSKVREAAAVFRERGVDMAFQLGDFTDAADDVETKIALLRQTDAAFRESGCECRHVVGNHCLDLLTKEEHLAAVGEETTYYSFDQGGFHFIVLDGCFRGDGAPYARGNFDWADAHIPGEQLCWLAIDLAEVQLPTIVFVHQRLDCDPPLGITDAEPVRELLEGSTYVRAVFQGHDHGGGRSEIGGIHYITLKGAAEGEFPEGNAYAVAELFENGDIHIEGFRRQEGIRLDAS